MDFEVPILTILRRFVPYVLLRGIVIPLATYLVLLGYGKAEARSFWRYCF